MDKKLLEELTERIENLEILVFILMYKNKPIMVNGKDVSKTRFNEDLARRLLLPEPPKQLNLFGGTYAQ
jgi:hypothetical protein